MKVTESTYPTSLSLKVGDSPSANQYTFVLPVSFNPACEAVSTSIVMTSSTGTAHSDPDSIVITGVGSQPFTVF